jgi:hypothetical protein
MGIFADIFVASAEHAVEYESLFFAGKALPAKRYERVEYKNLMGLNFGILWAIIEGKEWDADRHMLENITHGEEGETWLERFPDEFTAALAAMDRETMERVTVAWAGTEELQWPPELLAPVTTDLKRLAALARGSGKGLYLWGSL